MVNTGTNDPFWIFLTVARVGTLDMAAKELDMSTTSVMNYINKLENTIDVKLFERNTRGMTLTDAGRCFRNYAEEIVTMTQLAVERVQNMQEAE